MNNKAIAAAAGITLLAAAGMAAGLIIILSRKSTSVPQYSFESSSVYSSASSVQAPPEDEPAPTEDKPTPAEEISSEAAQQQSVTLSHDPLNYAVISFDGYTIHISGRYENGIKSIYLDSVYLFAELDSDGHSFSAVLNVPSEINGFDYLYFVMGNAAVQKYCIHLDGDIITLVGDETAANNSSVLQKPAEVSDEICALYVSADGDQDAIREALDEIQRISDEICAGIDGDYDKLRAISRWVSENIYYDFDARYTGVTVETISLCNVLKYHRSVCGGFSNLFAALCEAQGIRCYNIRGSVVPGGCFEEDYDHTASHEWTAAEIDGRLIWVDTVWNTSNSYCDGEYTKGETHMKFFDIADVPLGADHRAERCEYRSYFGDTPIDA